MKLVIASNNKGKIREYKQILEKHGYEVMSQSEAGLDLEVEETGTTFAENSALKARAAYKALGFDIKNYPNAYHLFENEVTLPLHTCLTDEEVEYVIGNFVEILKK